MAGGVARATSFRESGRKETRRERRKQFAGAKFPLLER
jgi:hypothetical protein